MDLQGQNGLLATYRVLYRSRGLVAYGLAAVFLAFYLVLYFTPIFDGPAKAIGLQNKWYLYGFLYTAFMAGGAVYYLRRHGNSRYNQYRIVTNVAVQAIFAFSIPFVMALFGQKDFYASYLWPLKIEYLFPGTILEFPVYLVLYSFLGSLVAFPVLAFLYGKRFYCSWICGCGGLANTFGDPWRHLSDKSTSAWRFELFAVHGVMILAFVVTILVGLDFALGSQIGAQLGAFSGGLRSFYQFIVVSFLSGIIGVGVYPILGPRIWCRNFCPMAAMLGLIHKFGRFRIRVKPDMCISCGNCSTYCEMGIDVRAYAQTNQDFTRASCVGCGMCAHMCPRGVLRLENVSDEAEDKRRQGMHITDF